MRSGRGGHRTWRRSIWRGWRGTRSKPSTEDSRQRYEARSVRMWWTPDTGMLQLHGQLPDVLGAKFEATIQQLTEQMKPAKGQRWDSFEHRAADALGLSCVTSLRSRTKDRRWHRGRCCRSPCPVAWPGGDRGDPDRRLAARATARQRAPSSRCWSTTTASPIVIGKRTPATVTEGRAGGAAARRALPLHRQLRRHLGPPGPSPSTPVLGRHRRHLRTWSPSPVATTPHSSPTGPGRWSATPTSPTASTASTSTTSAPNNANSSASHHHAPDRRPREEDEDVRCTSSRAPCALDARRRRRCRRAGRRASG